MNSIHRSIVRVALILLLTVILGCEKPPQGPGTVWVWGDNSFGQLAVDRQTMPAVGAPMPVPDVSGVIAIAAGAEHTLVVRTSNPQEGGRVYAAGRNHFGQLGDDSRNDSDEGVRVRDLENIVAVSAGGVHSVALRKDGRLFAWGADSERLSPEFEFLLGNGERQGSSEPVAVSRITDVQQVSAGGAHTLAITRDGRVWAWGRNDVGQLGVTAIPSRPAEPEPVPVNGLERALAVSAGVAHSLALIEDPANPGTGIVHQWGRLAAGAIDRPEPVVTEDGVLDGVVSITASEGMSIAVRNSGQIIAWGGGRPEPEVVGDVPCAKQTVGTVGGTFWTLRADGTVWMRSGDVDAFSPMEGLRSITAIAAGRGHQMVLRDPSIVPPPCVTMPPAPVDEHNPHGEPVVVTPDVTVTVLSNRGYDSAVRHDWKLPAWVSFRLAGEYFQKGAPKYPRSPRFEPDRRLEGRLQVRHEDYDNTGYDRGHMASDNSQQGRDATVAHESYLTANIIPQTPALNRQIWKNLEIRERKWAAHYGELYVITGPIFEAKVLTSGTEGIRYQQPTEYMQRRARRTDPGISTDLPVPTHCYKIFFRTAGDGLHALAVIMPNQKEKFSDNTDFAPWQVTIDEIEQKTGLDFLRNLEDSLEDSLEAGREPFWPAPPKGVTPSEEEGEDAEGTN